MVTSLYKIVAKVLSLTLKKLIPLALADSQNAFIEGRKILDCCLIANELAEEYRLKKMSGIGLKVDFEKAYISVDWGFLDFVLLKNVLGSDGGNG